VTELASVYSELPAGLRAELLEAFSQIVKNYRERRWEPSELNGGKLCEIAYSIIRGEADGKMPPRAKKPKNIVEACKAMEQEQGVSRSFRIQIPRMLVALYEIRNNRNVGHVGGDVDPNHMDAVCVLQMSKWVMAELVRVLHGTDVDTASEVVESLVERDTPLIWVVNGKKRVLATKLRSKDKMLLLLHASESAVSESDMVSWIEHSNPSVFRRDVVKPAHRARLLEYDAGLRSLHISPTGVAYVEDNLLPNLPWR
jgi:hypothetical protein